MVIPIPARRASQGSSTTQGATTIGVLRYKKLHTLRREVASRQLILIVMSRHT